MSENSAPLFTLFINGVLGFQTRDNEYAEQLHERVI